MAHNVSERIRILGRKVLEEGALFLDVSGGERRALSGDGTRGADSLP
jgi:hypothetical protein